MGQEAGGRVLFWVCAVAALAALVLALGELLFGGGRVAGTSWLLLAVCWTVGAVREHRRARVAPEPTPELSGELAADVDAVLRRDGFPAAVRLVQERTGAGLRPAAEAVRRRGGPA
jgi:hypothetical protein